MIVYEYSFGNSSFILYLTAVGSIETVTHFGNIV